MRKQLLTAAFVSIFAIAHGCGGAGLRSRWAPATSPRGDAAAPTSRLGLAPRAITAGTAVRTSGFPEAMLLLRMSMRAGFPVTGDNSPHGYIWVEGHWVR